MTDKVKAYIEELRRDNCLSVDGMDVSGLCVEANPCSSCVTHFALLFAVDEHAPEIRYVNNEEGGSFDSEQEAIDNWDTENDGEPNITTFVICSRCAGINNSAMEGADIWEYLPEVYFPCTELVGIAQRLGVEL